MDKLIEQALLENRIVRYIPTFEKVLKTYKRLLDEAEQQVKTCNKPAVITPLLTDKEIEEYVWEEYPFKLSQKDIDMNTETYKHYLSAVEVAKWARDNCNGL